MIASTTSPTCSTATAPLSARPSCTLPQERRDWVIEGGDELQVFDTDAGRVGILICYDVEFPELGRLLA